MRDACIPAPVAESPGRNMKVRVRAALALGCLAATAIPGMAQEEGLSLLSGAFNEAQALRGQALYYEQCLQCHGEAMEGLDKAPPLAGPQFGATWRGAPLAALVARIQTMPPDKPANVPREQAVDILSYMLWYNGLPLGAEELPAAPEVLGRLTFQTPVP